MKLPLLNHFSFIGVTSLLSIVLFVLISTVSIYFYKHSTQLLFNEMRSGLIVNAELASSQFTPDELASINAGDGLENPVLVDITRRLEEIRNTVPDLFYVYILRRTDNPDYLEFVSENDLFYTPEELDYNINGTVDENEVAIQVGEKYEVAQAPRMSDGFTGPTAEVAFAQDDWGTWMSAYAPIRDVNGEAVAIIGLDIKAEKFLALSQRIVSPLFMFAVILVAFFIALVFIVVAHRRRIHYNNQIREHRRAIVRQAISNLGDPISTLSYWTELLTDDAIDRAEAVTVLKDATTKLNTVVSDLNQITD